MTKMISRRKIETGENLCIVKNTEKKDIIRDKIITLLCNYYQMSLVDLTESRRFRPLVEKRQYFCWVFRQLKKDNSELYDNNHLFSLYEIGDILNYDHATVIHSVKAINNLMETDKAKRLEYTKLKEEIFNILNTEK